MRLFFRRSGGSSLGSLPLACSEVREAVSARFDGEPAGVGEDVIVDHLEGCGSCRYFASNVADLGRRVRVRSTLPAPPALLSSVRQGDSRRARPERLGRSWHPGTQWRSLAGWTAAIPPAALSISLLAFGIGAGHPHLVPWLTHTQCNSYLITHHLWSGY